LLSNSITVPKFEVILLLLLLYKFLKIHIGKKYFECILNISLTIQHLLIQVKHAIDCRPVTSNKCKEIKYQECHELPIEDCKNHDVMVPMQELVHKKKCLLPDLESSGDFDDAISPRRIEPDVVFLQPEVISIIKFPILR
jgi:hypothetical protein